MNRREFLQQAGIAVGFAAGQLALSGCGQKPPAASDQPLKNPPGNGAGGVAIVWDPADPVASSVPAQWAVGQLRESLAARNVPVNVAHRIEDVPSGVRCVLAAGRDNAVAAQIAIAAGVSIPDSPEAVVLASTNLSGRAVTLAGGSDERGLVYALTELADAVTHSENTLAALSPAHPTVERPANAVRGVMKCFTSDVEDKQWFNDSDGWRRYLSMLVAQRFNRFNLALGIGYDFARNLRDTYFYFAYPFLVTVPGYDVRAIGLPDAERESNLAMLRFISDEAAARGLHFQLGIWTHAYKWTDSPDVNYVIEGLTPQTQATYSRDSLKAVLQACPSISGVTFRIHGESGVAEGNYDFWKTVFDGVVGCGRQVEIDMHAKGMDQAMIDVALGTGMPVKVSPKFWAEHMGMPYHQAAIRPNELPRASGAVGGLMSLSSGSRSFLRYGYGDLLTEDRRYGVLHRLWPGTQRLLLWGDPVTAAAYARSSSFCSSVGLELFDPLGFKGRKGSGLPGGRDAYADASLEPQSGDWEKYLYSYRVWGRLLYNPDADPETWQRSLRTEFGDAAEPVESALAHASRILPLVTTAHCPSAANNNYWPEIYTNMPIVDASRPHPYGDSPSPKRFGTVSPLDPQLFSRIDDFADELIAGTPSGKYSPAKVAAWLAEMADSASLQLANAEAKIADRSDPRFRRVAVDVTILIGLGHFFSNKLRAGVLYALYTRSGDPAILDEALKAYRVARADWVALASQGDQAYVRDITFGWDKQLRGTWSDRLPMIDLDIDDVEKRSQAQPPGTAPAIGRERIAAAIAAVLKPVDRADIPVDHVPPASFRRGQTIKISLRLPQDRQQGIAPRILYRRVNQAEAYHPVEMKRADADAGEYEATIPAEYTDSPFPMQYYFQFIDSASTAWLFPGFNRERNNQPYFVIRQSRAAAART